MANGLAHQRVLIVEDEPMIAVLLEDMLIDLGLDVVQSAGTFADAEAACAEGSFDIAVLDVNLHGQMSYAVAERLAWQGVPVVLVSGYARDALPAALANAPFLTKPYRAEQVAAALGRALGLTEGQV